MMKDKGKGIFSKVSLEAFGMPAKELKVYVVLLSFAGPNVTCYPSVNAMRERMGRTMSRRTIERCIKNLIKLGWLKKEYRRGRSSLFTITTPGLLFGIDYEQAPSQPKKQKPTVNNPHIGPLRPERPMSDFADDFSYCNYHNGFDLSEVKFAEGVTP